MQDLPDILDEHPIRLKDVQRIHPQRPSIQCVRNWAKRGLRNPITGERVYLETYLNGQQRYTSLEAIRRFIVALNATGSKSDLDRLESDSFRQESGSSLEGIPDDEDLLGIEDSGG